MLNFYEKCDFNIYIFFKKVTWLKKIIIQHNIRFVNYSVIDHELLNKIIYDVGKLQRAHPNLRGHFASAYLVGSNMLRAYIFFIYDLHLFTVLLCMGKVFDRRFLSGCEVKWTLVDLSCELLICNCAGPFLTQSPNLYYNRARVQDRKKVFALASKATIGPIRNF